MKQGTVYFKEREGFNSFLIRLLVNMETIICLFTKSNTKIIRGLGDSRERYQGCYITSNYFKISS